MVRPRVTVDTAVLAPAVRIEIHGHPNIGAVVVAQDALRRVAVQLRRARRPIVIVIDALGDDGETLEATGRIARGAAAVFRARSRCHYLSLRRGVTDQVSVFPTATSPRPA